MTNVPATVEAEMQQEEQFNAADPKQVNNARKKSARNRRDKLEFVGQILSTSVGRQFMFGLLESCHIVGNPVVQGDTHATYFNLGAQNWGKLLLMDLMEFPDLYVQMMKESRSNK